MAFGQFLPKRHRLIRIFMRNSGRNIVLYMIARSKALLSVIHDMLISYFITLLSFPPLGIMAIPDGSM
jgi:hypothetical protein